MYLDKKNYQSFKFLVLTPKFLLTFLDKVKVRSLFCIT